MYSHGKKVDTSAIAIVYTGTRELRAKLKQMMDGDAVIVVGTKYNPRAVLIPFPKLLDYGVCARRACLVKLRVRCAAVLDRFDGW